MSPTPRDALTVQLVWAHPRTNSLSATIVADLREELKRSGASADEVDLYRCGFDAVLRESDEPDWGDLNKTYSPEVMRYTDRTREADAVVFIFPVWWYSVPALMKGYLERVWNYGTFYGDGLKSGVRVVRWIGLAGDSEQKYRKRAYDEMMAHHLNVGIAGFCGVTDSRLHLLYNTLGTGIDDMPVHVRTLRDTARAIIRDIPTAIRQTTTSATPERVTLSSRHTKERFND